jgi:hypothetical protein
MQSANTIIARILIAKHVPDIRRMEPRNIGVVVWSDQGIAARFVGDDTKKIRGFEEDSSVREWIAYWKHLIGKPEVMDGRGKLVHSTDPEFFELLKSKSKTQYALVEAGQLLERVGIAELRDVAESLFEELVSTAPKKESRSSLAHVGKQLSENVTEAIQNSDIIKINGFRKKYDWICNLGTTREYFHFDYAVHDGGPQMIMQRVPWKLDKVYSTAYQFQSMSTVYHQLTSDQCVSLVFASDTDSQIERISSAWSVLSCRGRVINVHDVDAAIKELNQLAS